MPDALPRPEAALPADLATLRGELDQVDDALQDLLLRRAGLVEQVGRLGVKGRVALRPGREAAIIRRLLGRHSGRFPRSSLVRLWRELLGGMTAMQGAYSVAVCDPDPASGYAAAAREHFGALIPLRSYRTPGQAMGQVRAGLASAAVLPLPSDGEADAAAWWTALLHQDEPRIHVTARLPFWTPRPEGAPRVQALVVSAAAPDPSGTDRSLLGLEVPAEHSRDRLAQALAASGLETEAAVLRRGPGTGASCALVEVEGFVTASDPRLASLAVLRPPVVVGAYAVPMEGTAP